MLSGIFSRLAWASAAAATLPELQTTRRRRRSAGL